MKTGISALLESVSGRLHIFSMAEDFWPLFERCFGSQHNQALAGELRRQWQEGDFGQLPKVEILAQEALGDAMGAYAIENRTIYLSDKLLGSFPTATAVDVLLEEIGHHVDALVNREDTPGDEGETFSYAARNVQLSEQKLSDIKAEDDHSYVNLDSGTVQVEKSGPIVLVVTTTVDEEDGSALIGTGLSLRDAVMIANGNPTISHLIKVASGSTYVLSGLVTNGTIAIEADGIATIAGDGSALVYLIKNTDSLKVRNLSISNPGGLAMLNYHGTMEIVRSNISNSGSGITNDLGILRIDSSEIVNNGNSLSHQHRSGAIANNQGISEIVNSKIANNTTLSGSVAGIANGGGTIRIINTEISGNSSFNAYTNALSSVGGQVHIEDSRFIDNSRRGVDNPYTKGSAIRIDGGSLVIKRTIVSGSEMGVSAGGDYVEIVDSTITDNAFAGLSIGRGYSIVRNNHISDNGSGLGISGKNAVILVEHNEVVGNRGTGISLHTEGNAASAIISSNHINSNISPDSTLYGFPSGIPGMSVNASLGARVNVSSNVITENKGNLLFDGAGVTIRTDSGAEVSLSSNHISNNITFHSSFAHGAGGVTVSAYGNSKFNLSSNEITSNSSQDQAGGVIVRAYDNSQINLSSNIITSNSSQGFVGGVTVVAKGNSKFNLSSNDITSNSSQRGAGGVEVNAGDNSQVNLSSNVITSNRGNSAGGVEIRGYEAAKVNLYSNLITFNSSQRPGGGVYRAGYNGGGFTQLKGNTISSNKATRGGGLYNEYEGILALAGNSIAGNQSSDAAMYYVHPDYYLDPLKYSKSSFFRWNELEGYDIHGSPVYRAWINDPRYPDIYNDGTLLAYPIFTIANPEPEPEPEPDPNRPLITLSNANTWLQSGATKASTLRFEVKLSSAFDEPVRVDYFTLDGSGSYGRLDFLPVLNNTLIFQPGETSKWIEVTAFGSQPITDTTLEIFARDTAYRKWSEADIGKELDKVYGYNDPGYKEYRVNRVFKDATTGFDGVGLTSDEKFFLVLANPQNATIASNPVDLLQQVAKESGGNDTEAYAEASNRITGLASSSKPYTYATGVIYDQAKPPVLALRGTEVSGKDILADLAPEGVGYRQFSSNKEQLFDWLRETSSRIAPSITGHSLGGALSQWVAASYDGAIDRVATFNSPGIAQREGFNLSRSTNSGIRHYITSADLPGLVGSTYLNGEWVKSSYRDESLKSIYSRILNKHSVPVRASSISRTSLDKPVPLTQALNSSTANLSDFWFTYLPDPEWLELQVKIAKLGRPLGPKGSVATAAIAAALTYRGTTELARKGLGYLVDLITDPVDTLSAAYDAAKTYTKAAWDAIFDQSNQKLGLSPSLPEGRVNPSIAELLVYKPEAADNPPGSSGDEIIGNFWDAVPAWNDAAWRATTKWSDKAWKSIQGWLPQAWKSTTEWSADAWEKPFVSMQDISVLEGDGPTTQLAFEIALSQASTSEVRVDDSLANGTALAGRDFLARAGSVVFEAGEVSKIITIEIVGDFEVEEDKTLFVQVTNPMNALVVDDQAVVTIENDDQPILVVEVSKVTLTSSPPGGTFNANARLSQEADNHPLRAIGVDDSRLDLGGTEDFTDNTVSIKASVTSNGATASASGINDSTLQLRPGNDSVTIEATTTGAGPGSSVAVQDSLVSGNRGNDTITLRGDLWGDRALVFGGAGNDTITGYGFGRDSFIQAGDGDDVVSLGRLETTPGALPLQRAKGAPIQPSTYRGGNGFDVLHLRDTTQAEFEAQATPFTTANESGWLFQGARFSGFEQFLFG